MHYALTRAHYVYYSAHGECDDRERKSVYKVTCNI